jgi:hypothetical protein
MLINPPSPPLEGGLTNRGWLPLDAVGPRRRFPIRSGLVGATRAWMQSSSLSPVEFAALVCSCRGLRRNIVAVDRSAEITLRRRKSGAIRKNYRPGRSMFNCVLRRLLIRCSHSSVLS